MEEFVPSLTARENFLIAANGGMPERIPMFPVDVNMLVNPVWNHMNPENTDFLGIKWTTNEFGDMPVDGYYAMKDISEWRNIEFPPVDSFNWEMTMKMYNEWYKEGNVTILMLNSHGLFLIPIQLLGWVEGLCALEEDPEEFEAFVSRLADYMIESFDECVKYIQPDIVYTGDDITDANGPFFSMETFDKIFAPHFKRIFDHIHEYGALVEFHCCGNCDAYLEVFPELGVDILQLPMPTEALENIRKERGAGNYVITGGWDRRGPGNIPGADEETVRESIRLALDTYAKDGGLLFWEGGVAGQSEDSKQKLGWIMDEVIKYGTPICQAKPTSNLEELLAAKGRK